MAQSGLLQGDPLQFRRQAPHPYKIIWEGVRETEAPGQSISQDSFLQYHPVYGGLGLTWSPFTEKLPEAEGETRH